MNEQNIKKVLQTILDNLQGKEFVWRLEGSANLKIQDINISVGDLDITTNEDGITIFRNALKEFIVKDFFSQKINCHSLVYDINSFEVEINSYGDSKLDMFDKTKEISWNDLQIPILPLKYAKKFYELINRKEKVDLITKYLSE